MDHTKNCGVQKKKVELTGTITSVHHKTEDADKDNKEDIIVKYIDMITEILQ